MFRRFTTVVAILLAAVVLAAPARGSTISSTYNVWSMDGVATTGSSANLGGGPGMTMYNYYRSAPGQFSGEAAEFYRATSYGIAHGSEGLNPGTGDFAMAFRFTSTPIPNDSKYSLNVMQKGLAQQLYGQVKGSLIPRDGGTVSCRFSGTKAYRNLFSKVVVDDGAWHTGSCWREGSRIGLTVDGVTTSVTYDVGMIETPQPVRIGNKLDTADETDQHIGANDCSVWVIGVGARALAESALASC